jgi:hypothetical protein
MKNGPDLNNAEKIRSLKRLLEDSGNTGRTTPNNAVLDDIAKIVFGRRYPAFRRVMGEDWDDDREGYEES